MYSTSDLKKGLIIDFDGAPHVVEKLTITSPQARGASTIFKVRLRNLKSKGKSDKSFRSGDTFGIPDFEKRLVQFLYRDADSLHFMDIQSYEQFHFQESDIEWEIRFLKDEIEGIVSLVYNEEIIGLEMPPTVELEIIECAPSVKGNSATARTKSATLETGHIIQVPEHISQGEMAKIDTRSGEFLGRVSS